MKIAITAVTGQLGVQIVKALLGAPTSDQIIGLAQNPQKATDLGIEVRPGDYDKPAQLESSLEGIDTLLLVSGNAAPAQRATQHRNVLNAAKSVGVSKIVYTSVQGDDSGVHLSPVVECNRQTESDI